MSTKPLNTLEQQLRDTRKVLSELLECVASDMQVRAFDSDGGMERALRRFRRIQGRAFRLLMKGNLL